MAHQSLPVKKISRIPAQIQKHLGPPPVLPTEDIKVYKRLVLAIANKLNPRDLLDWMLVNDIVYHCWQIRRLRLVQQKLIEIRPDQLRPEYLKLVRERAGKNLRRSVIHQEAELERFVDMLPNFATIDSLLGTAESRRAAAFREFERRRDRFGSHPRTASNDVIDAEIVEEFPAAHAPVAHAPAAHTPAAHAPAAHAPAARATVEKPGHGLNIPFYG